MASSIPAVVAAKDGVDGACGVVASRSLASTDAGPVVSSGGCGVEYVMRTVHMVLSWSEPPGAALRRWCACRAGAGYGRRSRHPKDQGPEPDRTDAPAAPPDHGAGWCER